MEGMGEAPGWALETMAACARAGGDEAWAREIEAARTERLFEETADEAWYARFPMVQRAKPRDLTPPERCLPAQP